MKYTAEFEFLVRKLARRYSRRGSDIQDFEQEARIAVLRAMKDWQEGSAMSLKNFVGFRIKHALKEFSRGHYRPGIVSLDAELSDDGETCHDLIGEEPQQEARLLRGAIEREMQSLSDHEQEAILLFAQGMSFTEVAQQLGIRRQSVDKTIRRAQKRLHALSNEAA